MVSSGDMLHVTEWHNGDKVYRPFSDGEMARRQDAVRGWMAAHDVDATLFTSYHCINYWTKSLRDRLAEDLPTRRVSGF